MGHGAILNIGLDALVEKAEGMYGCAVPVHANGDRDSPIRHCSMNFAELAMAAVCVSYPMGKQPERLDELVEMPGQPDPVKPHRTALRLHHILRDRKRLA